MPVEPVTDGVLAEARAFNAQLETTLAGMPSVHTLPPALVRTARRVGKGIFPAPVVLPELRDLEVPGRGGPIKLRIARPPVGIAPRGVYLHIHGGGWMYGAADMQDPYLAAIATAAGVVVASVEYRLAPEHPFPAGPDDCEDAARWLVTEGAAALEAPAEFGLGGESAGGHLAALTLIRLRDRGDLARAFTAVSFMFGAFDLSMTPSQLAWGARNLVLSGPILAYFGSAFAPGRSLAAMRDPELSPLYADLRRLPPAHFSCGLVDPLLDDSTFMAARWATAGNRAELRLWPEAVHGFTAFPIQLAALADASQCAFLARTLGHRDSANG